MRNRQWMGFGRTLPLVLTKVTASSQHRFMRSQRLAGATRVPTTSRRAREAFQRSDLNLDLRGKQVRTRAKLNAPVRSRDTGNRLVSAEQPDSINFPRALADLSLRTGGSLAGNEHRHGRGSHDRRCNPAEDDGYGPRGEWTHYGFFGNKEDDHDH